MYVYETWGSRVAWVPRLMHRSGEGAGSGRFKSQGVQGSLGPTLDASLRRGNRVRTFFNFNKFQNATRSHDTRGVRVAWFPRLMHRSGEGTGPERLFVGGPKGDVAYMGDPNVRLGRSQRSAGTLRPSFGDPQDLSPGVARPTRAYSRNAPAWGGSGPGV